MMYLLHNIGPRVNSNYNTTQEIMSLPSSTPISFDGLYELVYFARDSLRRFSDITIFVSGDHIGKDNSFDVGQPLARFCDWNQISEFCSVTNAKLGWHSWSHKNLCDLSDIEIRREITSPFYMKYFAYPYGNVDARVARLVEDAGYEAAWSVTQGDGSRFQQKRRYLNW